MQPPFSFRSPIVFGSSVNSTLLSCHAVPRLTKRLTAVFEFELDHLFGIVVRPFDCVFANSQEILKGN
jgi:hypothetical protein